MTDVCKTCGGPEGACPVCRDADRNRAANRYERIEQDFRGLLWRQYPGATTNQVHGTAKKLTALVREMNEDFARSKGEADAQ